MLAPEVGHLVVQRTGEALEGGIRRSWAQQLHWLHLFRLTIMKSGADTGMVDA